MVARRSMYAQLSQHQDCSRNEDERIHQVVLQNWTGVRRYRAGECTTNPD